MIYITIFTTSLVDGADYDRYSRTLLLLTTIMAFATTILCIDILTQ